MGFNPTTKDLWARGPAQAALHEQAAAAAFPIFGRKVYVRGVVEVSNFCRENCTYCGMRRDNRSLERERAQHDEIAELLIHQRPAAMTDVNLQTGEDPVAARDVVLPLIRTLRPIPVPLKIIAMSGLPLSPETFQELGLTEQTFISKPFDAPTLLNALHAVLAGK